MPVVNYIAEHKAFIEYASNEGLSSGERLVWYGLVHIMNSRAKGVNWPDGFIRIPNERLLTYVPLSFDTMARARNKLIQRGLISFVKGSRNSAIPMYQMHYLTVPNEENPQAQPQPVDNFRKLSTRIPECSDFYPQNSDKNAGNIGDKVGGNIRDNIGDNIGDIIYKLYDRPEPEHVYPEDVEEEQQPRARATPSGCVDFQETAGEFPDAPEPGPEEELAGHVAMSIHRHFGHRGTPEECRRIAAMAMQHHLEEDLVDESIRLAARNHARSIYAYLVTIYDEWSAHEVRTMSEYGQYQFAKDMFTGRLTGVYAQEYGEIMRKECAERKAKHDAEDAAASEEDHGKAI